MYIRQVQLFCKNKNVIKDHIKMQLHKHDTVRMTLNLFRLTLIVISSFPNVAILTILRHKLLETFLVFDWNA
jgi:hypothetical protein